MDKPQGIFVTEFENQFGEWVVFHAFRNKTQASLDAGTSGRVIECIEKSAFDALTRELAEVKEGAALAAQVNAKAADDYFILKKENNELKARVIEQQVTIDILERASKDAMKLIKEADRIIDVSLSSDDHDLDNWQEAKKDSGLFGGEK